MIDGVVGNKLLPANIRQDIIERADGIPLFVEEMTKAVLEAESEGAAERAIGVVPSPALAVPASLHAPLAVVHKPEAELNSALDRARRGQRERPAGPAMCDKMRLGPVQAPRFSGLGGQ